MKSYTTMFSVVVGVRLSEMSWYGIGVHMKWCCLAPQGGFRSQRILFYSNTLLLSPINL